MMPTICDGSSLVNGNRKPVTLVSIVVARKIAVEIRDGSDFNHPTIAIRPATMPIKLIKTCSKVKVLRLMPNMICLGVWVFDGFDWNSSPVHHVLGLWRGEVRTAAAVSWTSSPETLLDLP